MQMQQQQNSNRTIVVQPPPLSRDPIFAENHLGYVMTNRDTLRGYLTESLSIDGVFLGNMGALLPLGTPRRLLWCPCLFFLKKNFTLV